MLCLGVLNVSANSTLTGFAAIGSLITKPLSVVLHRANLLSIVVRYLEQIVSIMVSEIPFSRSQTAVSTCESPTYRIVHALPARVNTLLLDVM